MSGQVIGINAQIESDSGGNDGVGFAIPADAAKNVANTLISGGKVQHAYLGIRVADASSAGAQITTVVSGSPAEKGGLKAGDVITAIDGTAVTSADDLTAQVGAHQPSDVITVTVDRNGSSKDVKVTLGVRRRPSSVASPLPDVDGRAETRVVDVRARSWNQRG